MLCGEDDTFRAIAESEIDLWDKAAELAYENLYSYHDSADLAREEGWNPDKMTEEDWNEFYDSVDEYYYINWSVEECENDEEWNQYSGEIYGENQVLQ